LLHTDNSLKEIAQHLGSATPRISPVFSGGTTEVSPKSFRSKLVA